MTARSPGGPRSSLAIPCARRLLALLATTGALLLAACSAQLLEPVDLVDRAAGTAPADAATAATAGGDADADAGPTAVLDSDEATLALVSDGGYAASPSFAHVSRAPYASTGSPGSFVDVWVSSGAYGAYAAISPDGGAVDAGLPLGAVIVRAVSDATGAVTKLTLMRHGPSGLDPSLGDWWFAETDPAGTPLSDDAGPLVGPLAGCRGCHLPRASDDYLFGVPLDAR